MTQPVRGRLSQRLGIALEPIDAHTLKSRIEAILYDQPNLTGARDRPSATLLDDQRTRLIVRVQGGQPQRAAVAFIVCSQIANIFFRERFSVSLRPACVNS